METPQPGIGNEASQYEKEVFVSYAWGGKSEHTVDELEQVFAKHDIRIMRDKKDLHYKGSIKTFEQRIGKGQCVILVISDKYLRSEHCMYELLEMDKNQELHKRIFPIVLADARIYKAKDRLIYIKYWEEQINQLDQGIKKVSTGINMTGINAELDRYARIRASFDHLTDLLSDMNALTPEIHTNSGFSTLISAVEETMAERQIVFQDSKVKTQLVATRYNDKREKTKKHIVNSHWWMKSLITHEKRVKSEKPKVYVITGDFGTYWPVSIDDLIEALKIEFEYFQEGCAIITEQLRPNCATRQFAMQYANISNEWPDRSPELWMDNDPETALELAKERVKYQNQKLSKFNELTGRDLKDSEFVDLLLNDVHHFYTIVALKKLSSNINDDWKKYLGIYNKLHINPPLWRFMPEAEMAPLLRDWKNSIDSSQTANKNVFNEYQEIHTWLESQNQKMDDWINSHIVDISRKSHPGLDEVFPP